MMIHYRKGNSRNTLCHSVVTSRSNYITDPLKAEEVTCEFCLMKLLRLGIVRVVLVEKPRPYNIEDSMQAQAMIADPKGYWGDTLAPAGEIAPAGPVLREEDNKE